MKDMEIYLCGGMAKFGKEEFNKSDSWRKDIEYGLKKLKCEMDFNYKFNIINPNNYYNFIQEPPVYDNNREVMEFDLNKVRKSDLLIINFNDVQSLGSMAELAIAYDRQIPIIGLNIEEQILHPWQKEMCNKIFNSIKEMTYYIANFYLM